MPAHRNLRRHQRQRPYAPPAPAVLVPPPGPDPCALMLRILRADSFTRSYTLDDSEGVEMRGVHHEAHLRRLAEMRYMRAPIVLPPSLTGKHIFSSFIDHTNIAFGLRAWAAKNKLPIPRLCLKALHLVLSGGLPLRAGWTSSSTLSLADHEPLRAAGYELITMSPVGTTRDHTRREQMVDEQLHTRIEGEASDWRDDEIWDRPAATFAIATGDGAAAEFNPGGFYEAIVKVLRAGVSVQLWGWDGKISNRLRHLEVQQGLRGRMQIFLLDPYAKFLIEPSK